MRFSRALSLVLLSLVMPQGAQAACSEESMRGLVARVVSEGYRGDGSVSGFRLLVSELSKKEVDPATFSSDACRRVRKVVLEEANAQDDIMRQLLKEDLRALTQALVEKEESSLVFVSREDAARAFSWRATLLTRGGPALLSTWQKVLVDLECEIRPPAVWIDFN